MATRLWVRVRHHDKAAGTTTSVAPSPNAPAPRTYQWLTVMAIAVSITLSSDRTPYLDASCCVFMMSLLPIPEYLSYTGLTFCSEQNVHYLLHVVEHMEQRVVRYRTKRRQVFRNREVRWRLRLWTDACRRPISSFNRRCWPSSRRRDSKRCRCKTSSIARTSAVPRSMRTSTTRKIC